LVRALTEDGYAVDLSTRVDDARHQVETNEYDVVVLDVGLPDGNGLDLCAEFRAEGNAVPVLMLTARDSHRTRRAPRLKWGTFGWTRLRTRCGAVPSRCH